MPEGSDSLVVSTPRSARSPGPRDGAMSAASIDVTDDVGDTFRRGVEGLITVVHVPGSRPHLPA